MQSRYHPLESPSRGELQPPHPDDYLNVPAWQNYVRAAKGWLADLEGYARNEQRRTGKISTKTRELIREAKEDALRWGEESLHRAVSFQGPNGWEIELIQIEMDRALHKARWRKTCERDPRWLKDRDAKRPGSFETGGSGMTAAVLDELAAEQSDVMTFLESADLRSPDEIVSDAVAEIQRLPAQKSPEELEAEAFMVCFELGMSDEETFAALGW
jgi:hypothetical protein